MAADCFGPSYRGRSGGIVTKTGVGCIRRKYFYKRNRDFARRHALGGKRSGPGRTSAGSLAGMSSSAWFKTAGEHFGTAELTAVKAYGADTIRIQVSQAGLDPESSIYSASYIAELKTDLELIRSKGFNLIVSMQSESPSGIDQTGMPTAATQRSWKSILPFLKDDTGIMLEVFNEPQEGAVAGYTGSTLNWTYWSQAHQPLINAIRSMGAKNVLIVDGLYAATSFKGAPSLNDPAGQLAYGIHPYPSSDNANTTDLETNFGNYAKTHPMIATEFNARSTVARQCFNGTTPTVAANLLTWLASKNMGKVGWALDYPGTLIKDFNNDYTDLTNFSNYKCDTTASPANTDAMGLMLHTYFTTGKIKIE